METVDERIDGDSSPALTPGVARAERRDAAEHRRQILQTAHALFAEAGVEAVSMHQIAQAAGVGQGTLYRRYAHKGELCLDLVKEGVREFWDETDAYLDKSASTGVPALERLGALVERFVRLIEEKAHYLAQVGDATCKDRRAMQFNNPIYRWMHDRVSTLLHEATVEGTVAPLNVTYTADSLLAAVGIDLYLFQRDERHLTPDEIIAGIRRVYIDGLRIPGLSATQT